MEPKSNPRPIKEIVPEALSQITQKGSEAEGICCLCGKTCRVNKLVSSASWKCAECAEAERKEVQESDREAQEEDTLKRLEDVPTLFRGTDQRKLPFPEKLDAAFRWKFGPKGLLLHGRTGSGKSRIIWEVAKREIHNGRKLRSVAVHELFSYPALLMNDAKGAERFATELIRAPLLLLDDPFKTKPTERVEELLFCVIDERGQWERPCLVTMNDTGETLEVRLSIDRGPALIRRLREYCMAIQF